MEVTSEAVQRWVRIGLYTGFGALANHGFSVSASNKELIISVIGFVMTVAWTKYGTRLNAMLTEIGKIEGVESAVVKVNPELINPRVVVDGTPDNVVAVPAKPK